VSAPPQSEPSPEDAVDDRVVSVDGLADKALPEEEDKTETSDGLPWGKLGLIGVALVLIFLLLGVELARFERLLLSIPIVVIYAALGIAWVLEKSTTRALEEALKAIACEEAKTGQRRSRGGRQLLALADDPWSRELERLRSDYLLDVRAHAERWRTIFGSLLAVFGAIVFLGRPQTLNISGQTIQLLILLTVLGLSAGLTAVAMAGWAAAAAPKIDWLKQTDPKELRRKIFFHANRSVARLRAALTCGVIAIVAVLAGTVIVLLHGQG
jgi:hypothetical protein